MARRSEPLLTVEVGPASDAERAHLHAHIEPDTVTAVLTDWCVVASRVALVGVGTYDVALFGRIAPTGPRDCWRSRLTSIVLAIDPAHGLVRTVHSLYAVAGPERLPTPKELDLIGARMASKIVRWMGRVSDD